MNYIYQRKNWPLFTWDATKLAPLLAEVRHIQGRVLGRMHELGFQLCEEASLQILAQDIIKTSEIEGEKLDYTQVRSSIAKRLGINIGAMPRIDRAVEGIVEIILDATGNFDKPLSKNRLYHWQKILFPNTPNGLQQITVGRWRTQKSGPMRVISGPIGREKVHYEAPSYTKLEKEMTDFLKWFNTDTEIDLVIKSAIAHFWFVTIHPFEDGNGRIARALADMVLARSEKSKQRFYSMSSQIQHERNAYYAVLENCQKGSLDITLWIEWFLNCLKRAILASETMLKLILLKARFWAMHQSEFFNERQRAIINRLFDGLRGKLTSSKWAKLSKCSQDTALRDINDLIERKILLKDLQGGRSTRYQLNLP